MEPLHDHVTRDIKDPGKCSACDLYWERESTGAERYFNERLEDPEYQEAYSSTLNLLRGPVGELVETDPVHVRWREFKEEIEVL